MIRSIVGHINGNEIYYDPKTKEFRYTIDDVVYKRFNEDLECIYVGVERPCPLCNRLPIDGMDACISNRPGVLNACCGHGIRKGYVQFENGIIIRGDFSIEKIDNPKG